jgi:IPTL-CTERM motif
MKSDSTLRRRFVSGGSLVVLLCLAAPVAIGAPISYVFSGPASGSLGATPFAGAQVTVTSTADTANVTTFGGFAAIPCINLTSVTINITGVGSATTTGQNALFDNHTVQAWGMNSGPCVGGGGDWLDVTNALAATYGLVTSIGPTTGVQLTGGSVATTAGTLTFTAVPPTFQATLGVAAPVPTLSQWVLILLGVSLACMAVFILRRRTLSSH